MYATHVERNEDGECIACLEYCVDGCACECHAEPEPIQPEPTPAAKEKKTELTPAQVQAIKDEESWDNTVWADVKVSTMVQDALDVLVKQTDPDDPKVVLHGGLTRFDRSRMGTLSLDEYGPESMHLLMDESIDFATITGGGKAPKPLPTSVSKLALYYPQQRYRDMGIIEVDTIARTPFYAWVDGEPTLVSAPGYHEPTKTFIDLDPVLEGMGEVKPFDAGYLRRGDGGPMDEWAIAKHVLMHELLGDFPFDSEADMANAVALTLLPFVRPLIRGATPLHAIQAPSPGSGKGYLASACMIPAMGMNVASKPMADSDEEVRKAITAQLMAGQQVVQLDNIEGVLNFAALKIALTQPIWQDRILGQSKVVDIPVRCVWVATANNLKTNEETARRILPIFIDPGVANPNTLAGPSRGPRAGLPWLHDPLIDWAMSKRRDLIWACLTIIEAWVQEGHQVPRFSHAGEVIPGRGEPLRRGTVRMGNYEEYAQVMGGILETIGVEGFWTNHAKLLEASTGGEGALAADLLEAIHQVMGAEAFSVAMLKQHIGAPPMDSPFSNPDFEWPESMAALQVGSAKFNSALTTWLRDNQKRPYGDGWRLIRKSSGRNGGKDWRVQAPA